MTQELERGQSTTIAMEELEAQLQAAVEEKQRLDETWRSEVASLQAKQEETVALATQLTAEREGLRGKLAEVGDAQEVTLSEMSSLQADLATVRSERNTQLMSADKVSNNCFLYESL